MQATHSAKELLSNEAQDKTCSQDMPRLGIEHCAVGPECATT